MRLKAHAGFVLAALAATFGGGWLWYEWGPAVLLNGVGAICG